MSLQEDLNFSRIAHLTPGYVGADLMTLTRESAMHAVNRFVLNRTLMTGQEMFFANMFGHVG